MKVAVCTEGRRITVWIPNCMLTSHHFLAFFYWITKKTSGKYSPQPMPDLSAAQLKPLCRELRRIRKSHGAYELVEVQSGKGQQVKIVL